ncbi:hypothetical protein LO763_10865 [Glycomyces sp. A-F 0318]|uniref:effector-associated constant component EACC1 n=1 Tax=Glycomyces amatae TaxID=2881355 RepID=UPI001E6441C1|nr:hypothetical protein [Glycomyces amatae]
MNPLTSEPPRDAPRVPTEARISVSDQAELRSLREHLRRIRGAQVEQVAAEPEAGALGSGELLQIAVPAAGLLAVVVRTLPEFIRSRRSSVSVTVETADWNVTVSGENLDDVESVIKRVLPDA